MSEQAGRYRTVRLLAEGRVARIFEAVATSGPHAGRRVALERLLPEHASNPAVARAFVEELGRIAGIEHPGIASILDFGVEESGPFQVLELVHGVDLDEAMVHAPGAQKFPLSVAIHIGAEVARALDYAHGVGLVHRDVSPNNVMICWDGQVKLVGFGHGPARRVIETTLLGRRKTASAFRAPEQAMDRRVDGRADLYALGCLVHWMLTGDSPIQQDTLRIRVYAGAPVPISPDLPPDVAAVLQSLLRFHPDDRPKTGAEVAERLLALSAVRGLEPHSAAEPLAGPAFLEWLGVLRSVSDPTEPHNGLADTEIASREDQDTVLSRPRSDANTRIDSPLTPTPQRMHRLSVDRLEPTEQSDWMERETESEHDPFLGRSVHGYRITRLIGEGGFSRVYHAQHESLDLEHHRIPAFGRHAGTSLGAARDGPPSLEHAVKILSMSTVSESAARRLHREAQVLSGIDHPNVVRVVDFGALDDGQRPFLTMELLEGRTLREILEQDGALPPRTVARLGAQIARGLAAAHAAGLVHRDLKPGNVMVLEHHRTSARGRHADTSLGAARDGPPSLEHGAEQVKLLDFGIARSLTRTDQTSLTSPAVLLGTPAYMAPEQIADASSVTPASDLYGLGAVLFAMLLARPPFSGDYREIVRCHLEGQLPDLTTASRPEAGMLAPRSERPGTARPPAGELGELILALLRKHPNERPVSASWVADCLEAMDVEGTRATRPLTPRPAPEVEWNLAPARRSNVGLYVLVPLVVLSSALLSYAWRRNNMPASEPAIVPPPARVEAVRRPEAAPISVSPAGDVPEATATEGDEIEPPTKQRERSDSERRPAKMFRPAAARAALARALSRAELTLADLEGDSTSALQLRRFEAALRELDQDAAAAARAELEAELPRLASDRTVMEAKLERVASRLRQASRWASPDEVAAFEARYFELRSAFDPARINGAGIQRLIGLGTALERELER